MANENEDGHMFLQLGRFHLNPRDAEKYVLDELQQLAPGRSRNSWKDSEVTITTNGKPSTHHFRSLVREARERGYAIPLQRATDTGDAYFGGRFGLSTNSEGLDLGSTVAGEAAHAKGPASSYMVEVALTEDIGVARSDVCDASRRAKIDWGKVGRGYRAYVYACTAVVEYFLNHHVHVAKTASRLPQDWHVVAGNFDESFNQWSAAFLRDGAADRLRQTPEWCHLVELRRERNRLIHGVSPVWMLSLREVPRYLNHVRTGVGGFLSLIRSEQALRPLGFQRHLATLPEVSFVSFRP